MQLQQARWHNDPAQFAAVQGVAQPFFQVSDDRRVKWQSLLQIAGRQ